MMVRPSTAAIVVTALAAFHGANGLQVAVTPVEKVITLLKALKMEIQGEAKTEARSYDQFACFCKDMTDTKSKSIISGRDSIDSLSAEIETKTATKEEKTTELQERTEKQEAKAKELADAKALYAKEKAEYIALAADLSKAISSLEKAVASLEAAKPTMLLSVKETLENSLTLAGALNLKVPEPKHKAVMAFIQQAVDPLDPSYKYRSGGIISTLQDLLGEFRQKKKETDDEWVKAEAAHKATIKSIEDIMAANKLAMDQLSTDILKLAGEIAGARTDLVNAEATLKDDQLYLKDLTTRCEARANDWDQRSQLRNDELEAIAGALTILHDNVTSADSEVNERAMMLAQKAPVKSLLQTETVENVEKKAVVRANGKILSTQAKMSMIASILGAEGKRLSSTALTALAIRVTNDPFDKVKRLIQDLIERLLAEATAEATKKGFCDEELGKANKDRDYRLSDANALNAELEQLEVKQDALEQEIEVLTSDIDMLKKTLANATAQRKDEHDENMHTLEVAEDGLKSVKEATDILRQFYKEAAKAKVLLQASPVDEDTDGAGFKGAYKGRQVASKGIIGMLEVIITDFERTLRVTEAEEAKAHADFVLFDRASKADISGKEMKKELDEQDLATTKTTIAQKMNDLQTAMDLVDAALKKLEGLKPTCIDTGMSYAERVAKREEEVAALKKALCILDEDGVEPACKGR